MAGFNTNLLGAAGSPIMEAGSWVAATQFPADRPLIDLSQAAPAKPPHRSIRERLAEAMLNEDSAHHYCAVLGRQDLRQQVAQQSSDIYGGAIQADNVAITAGCNQAFCVAIQSCCAPGDAVLLPVPWYFNHKMWLDMAGIDCIPLPSGPDMLPDLNAAQDLMTDRVRAIVLVTPNNPTGVEYPDALMNQFFDLAQRSEALLIVDETYRDFHSQDGAPHTLFQRPDWGDTLAHLYSFSKTYRIMGHRTGAMLSSAARVAQAEKFLDTVTICPSQTGQIAALHGLQTLGNWVAGEQAEFRKRCQTVKRLFAEALPDWTLHGAGAYFAWVTPPHGLESTVMAKRLVQEQSLLTLPGAMFHPKGAQTMALRIAFANADDAGLHEMVHRLGTFRA